jgi:hypothetical protein
MPVARRRADNELSESLRHDADAGPVIMPSYTVLNREHWIQLLELADASIEEREFKIAWKRRNEPEGASLDVMGEKYGL